MAQRFDDLLSPRKRKRSGSSKSATLLLFSGHASHDNNLRKIKERFYLACVAGAKRGGRGGGRKAPFSTPATQSRFYWPDYSKDTMEMVSYKFYLFANAPS